MMDRVSVTRRNLKLLTLSTLSPLMEIGVYLLLFPKVNLQLCGFTGIKKQVVALAPSSPEPHLLPVGRLAIAGNRTSGKAGVVGKLNDSVGV